MIDSFKKILLLSLAFYLLSAPKAFGATGLNLKAANEMDQSFKTGDTGLAFRDLTYIWYKEGHSLGLDNELRSKIGWVYPANSQVLQIKKYADGRFMYQSVYNINQIGQRTLPVAANKSEHLIIAGDSNTFGVGLNDEETLPFMLSKKHPNYHAYNFGHGGGGPHNTLALFESMNWYTQIKEPVGKMIYIYYPQWLNERPIGSKNYLAWDKGMSPWYEIENGELVYKGLLKDKLQSKFYNFIRLIDYFKLVGNLPRISTDHLKLITKLFEGIKKQYLMEFPMGKFSVVVSKYGVTDMELCGELISLLKAANIDVVVINENPIVDLKLHFPDFHFNYDGQKMIEKELSRAIKFEK